MLMVVFFVNVVALEGGYCYFGHGLLRWMLFWTDNKLMLLFWTWSIKVDVVILDRQ